MMASVDAEAEMENLFAEDEAQEAGTQSLTQEEGRSTMWFCGNKVSRVSICRGAKSWRPVQSGHDQCDH